MPMLEPSPHAAGLASKTWSGHACWIVVSRDGSAFGSVTMVFPMFACPSPGEVTLTTRLAPPALLVLASVNASNVGLNGKLGPLVTWRGWLTPTAGAGAAWWVAVMGVGV